MCESAANTFARSEICASLFLTDCLASEAQRGATGRFSELYERVAPRLYVWAELKMPPFLRRRTSPEDVVQETWVRALVKFSEFDPERGSFRGWVFGFSPRTILSQRCEFWALPPHWQLRGSYSPHSATSAAHRPQRNSM